MSLAFACTVCAEQSELTQLSQLELQLLTSDPRGFICTKCERSGREERSNSEEKSSTTSSLKASESSVFVNPFMAMSGTTVAIESPEMQPEIMSKEDEITQKLEGASKQQLSEIVRKMTAQQAKNIHQRSLELQQSAKAMQFLRQRCISLESDNRKLYQALVAETQTSTKFREKFSQVAAAFNILQQNLKQAKQKELQQQQMAQVQQTKHLQQQQLAQIQQQIQALQNQQHAQQQLQAQQHFQNFQA